MSCPGCGFTNPDEMRYCGKCGVALPRSCMHCRFTNPAEFTFCGRCGRSLAAASEALPPAREPRAYTPRHLVEKIFTSRSALEGERKQVTVLFADIHGSMDLAEQIDAEEWHRLLDRFFGILSDGVHRFEGTVNQYTGDGIMALFGAPIAHEDHAQRACYAALYLRDGLRRYADTLRLRGLNFSVRMGLNSGEVVVGKIGDDLRMDYTAHGHTVGLAARMEQIAEPGKAYLTQHTARLVEGFVALRDLGAAQIKGVHDPVQVYELEGAGPHQTRFDVSRARGLSRFVGRREEMAVLEAALRRACTGDAQIVGIVADAGVGKSRLCHEFLERCRHQGIPTTQGHGLAHATAVPLLPIAAVLRSHLGITAEDTPAAARDRIAGRVLRRAPASGELLAMIFEQLGVGDPNHPLEETEPDVRRAEVVRAIRLVLEASAIDEPMVVLLEDAHWFDDASNALLASYAEAIAGTRVLMVVNFRPAHRADWMQQRSYQQLALRPLEDAAVDALLSELLGNDPSIASLQTMIRGRTGGNPFFVEEIVRSLVESGSIEGRRGAYRLVEPVERLAIPASVHATVAARIDRLGERTKAVLQVAAVIGKEFSEPLLRRVCEAPEEELARMLDRLVLAEFVYAQAMYPERELAFKHPLTQELAYRSQLAEPRARTHAAVAHALEDLHADTLGAHAALLEHHWRNANRPREAARWHRRALLKVTRIHPRQS